MTVARAPTTLAGGLLLLAVSVGAAETSPHSLLDRMNEAVRLLDYEGRFVVQVGDELDAMYIVHRLDGGSEKERVVSLTGKPREIIRSDRAVACLVSGRSKPINIGRREHGRSFSPLRGVDAGQLDAYYDFRLHEPARIAGRDAHQLMIAPRDGFRFGYRLFIDHESGLPLRSVMLDEQRQVVSQMMFVELRVSEDITPIEHDLSAMQVARGEATAGTLRERLAPPDWAFADLPPGFNLNLHRRRTLDGGRGEREHFVFSDGLATVSVYVQPASASGGLRGVSRMGSARAVGRLVGDHEVVVVGEVPLETLNWFAQRIEPADK